MDEGLLRSTVTADKNKEMLNEWKAKMNAENRRPAKILEKWRGKWYWVSSNNNHLMQIQ